MMRKFYCYLADEYIGKLVFQDSGEMSFTWTSNKNLSEYASKFRKFIDLSDTRHIALFIADRCIDENRPDRSLWLSMIGLDRNVSNNDIFIANHGRAIQDLFWISEVKSNKFYFEHPEYF